MQQKYNILKATIPITKKNRERVLSILPPGITYPIGSEIDFHYSVDSDTNLGLANCSKKKFQSLLWALRTYPTLVNEIESEQLELHMKRTRKQMIKMTKRLKKLLKAISTIRNSK